MESLETVNQKYKVAEDLHEHVEVFSKGDFVIVDLHKGRLLASTDKFKKRKREPFQIINKINDNAYVIDFLLIWVFLQTFNVADISNYYPHYEFYFFYLV